MLRAVATPPALQQREGISFFRSPWRFEPHDAFVSEADLVEMNPPSAGVFALYERTPPAQPAATLGGGEGVVEQAYQRKAGKRILKKRERKEERTRECDMRPRGGS